jgi:hypothetical protein
MLQLNIFVPAEDYNRKSTQLLVRHINVILCKHTKISNPKCSLVSSGPKHSSATNIHSHHDVMELWMTPHFGKDGSTTFFFQQNGPLSQFLPMWQNFSIIISQRDKVTDR